MIFLAAISAFRSAGGWHQACVSQTAAQGGLYMSVEKIISVGLLGWLVVGIVLMGLDIW